MKKFLLVCGASLLVVSVLGGCLKKAKATRQDYEKALVKFDKLAERAFVDEDWFSDEDKMEIFRYFKDKIKNLQELEIQAERTGDYTEIVEKINDISDDFEDEID